jgi:hypothetical protein
MFLQNTGNHIQDYMVLQPSRPQLIFSTLCETHISYDTVDSYQLIKEFLVMKFYHIGLIKTNSQKAFENLTNARQQE